MGLSSIVLAPFVGAHNLFSISYYSRTVEALLECIYDQGARRNMVTADPSVDIAQQSLPLFYGDTTLQDPGVASPVELALNKERRRASVLSIGSASQRR